MSTCVCMNGRYRLAAFGVLAAVTTLANPSAALGQCAPDCSPVKQNIECLNPSPQYDNRTFVGQLLLNGSPWCTAWIVASNGTESVVMTNEHCTVGQTVTNMDVKFNFQCNACAGGTPAATQTFPVTGLITQNAALDYALLRVGGDPAATFGIAQVDPSVATVGMGIYEIHHAGGLVKGYDQGTVLSLSVNQCVNNEIAVSNLVASGGASGSPIFRLDNHCVTAICNCGPPCQDGFGVPMSNIIPNAQPILQGAGFDFTMCGQAPPCPGTGSCCVANGTPGCDDATCCSAICANDPFCCNSDWDQICANAALADPGNCPQCIPPPPNDDCANAIPIAPNSVTSGTTTAATFDNTGFCGTINTAPGVWYSVVGTGTDITATTCELNCSGAGGANYDTKISVFRDGCAILTCVEGNDDNCSGGSSALLSTVTWCAEPGVKYLVLVHGFITQTGDFVLELCKGAPCLTGACCIWDGTCVDVPSQADCAALGGQYQGDFTACATSDCTPPTGVNFFLDPVAFDAALASTGKQQKNFWNFKPNNVPLGGLSALDDPLDHTNHQLDIDDPWAVDLDGDGIPDDAWDPATFGPDNVTFQSNLGPNPQPPLPNPRGIDGLALTNAFGPLANNLLVANTFLDSFDILSGPPPSGPPPSGNCCFANGTPGCEDPVCEAAVCALDPFCCDTSWDDICAGEAAADPSCDCVGPLDNHTAIAIEIVDLLGSGPVLVTVYGKDEAPLGKIKVDTVTIPPPPSGNCCVAHPAGNPGCEDPACEAAICAADPFCCANNWDGLCSNAAQMSPSCDCVNPPPVPVKVFLGMMTKNDQVTIGRVNLFSLSNGAEGISSIALYECTCPADLNGDCVVNSADLTILLGAWAAGTAAGDIDGDGDTDSADLTLLLGAWAAGACGPPPPATCAGGTCAAGFPACGGDPTCFCVTLADGSGSCTTNVLCAGLTLCPAGTCPPGFECQVDTCCVDPICVPVTAACGGVPLAPPPPGTRTTLGIVGAAKGKK